MHSNIYRLKTPIGILTNEGYYSSIDEILKVVLDGKHDEIMFCYPTNGYSTPLNQITYIHNCYQIAGRFNLTPKYSFDQFTGEKRFCMSLPKENIFIINVSDFKDSGPIFDKLIKDLESRNEYLDNYLLFDCKKLDKDDGKVFASCLSSISKIPCLKSKFIVVKIADNDIYYSVINRVKRPPDNTLTEEICHSNWAYGLSELNNPDTFDELQNNFNPNHYGGLFRKHGLENLFIHPDPATVNELLRNIDQQNNMDLSSPVNSTYNPEVLSTTDIIFKWLKALDNDELDYKPTDIRNLEVDDKGYKLSAYNRHYLQRGTSRVEAVVTISTSISNRVTLKLANEFKALINICLMIIDSDKLCENIPGGDDYVASDNGVTLHYYRGEVTIRCGDQKMVIATKLGWKAFGTRLYENIKELAK